MNEQAIEPTADYKTNCRICGREIVVQIALAYYGIGDPFNLLQKATCNRCFDLRTRQMRLEYEIRMNCIRLLNNPRMPKDDLETIRVALEQLTKKYSRYVCDCKNLDASVWDCRIVDDIMNDPDNWQRILRGYRDVFQTMAAMSMTPELPLPNVAQAT